MSTLTTLVSIEDRSLPASVGIVSHNLWLLPAPNTAWPLGRTDRCATHLGRGARECAAVEDGASLIIVAVQEAWALRAGVLWILLYLWSKLESALLWCGCAGGHEPLLLRVPKFALIIIVIATSWITSWLPFLGRVMWDPKPRIATALRSSAGLSWFTSGATALSRSAPWAWPPIILDSGLLLIASEPADERGFVPYERSSNGAYVIKGMLWARWGSLCVVNTHMTFCNADGGLVRRKQQQAMARLVASFLGHGDVGTTVCDAVLVVGDLNHCLPKQTTRGARASEAPSGMDREPSQYRQPWLPAHADISVLMDVLRMNGKMRVERLSGDEPTNEDGTIDHILVITLANRASTYHRALPSGGFTSTVADAYADVSDHLLIKALLRRSNARHSDGF